MHTLSPELSLVAKLMSKLKSVPDPTQVVTLAKTLTLGLNNPKNGNGEESQKYFLF